MGHSGATAGGSDIGEPIGNEIIEDGENRRVRLVGLFRRRAEDTDRVTDRTTMPGQPGFVAR
ncbi:hypothetical protein MFORT_24807 [Mycolicibacterium fortuitum subsp. fortuitum DSM 46621 = ATCC 6841 = JCM 6387]|uniref:Uncharacterized protein n=1 Tax=Mycolicibacterium fortuitum subsp. fortuitum DSM 46621 = ATCC 6841 = JCM 6387 TaxID=1214102 RepID=K0V084_MYCFO|nr:hypothetical protein MFORT_24807 [Mycolicibacterium fortuitum subsp. fortuitum DSM 46621 = ATCC 6841 = JCM 6387]